MEKTITTRQWAVIKRTAQNVQPLVQRKQRLQKQITEIVDEYKAINAQVQGFEMGIKALCGGLGTEQLVVRVVTPLEGKFDKDGKQMKKTTFEPSSLISYDPEKNIYTLHIPEPTVAPPADEQPAETPAETPENPAADTNEQPSADTNEAAPAEETSAETL